MLKGHCQAYQQDLCHRRYHTHCTAPSQRRGHKGAYAALLPAVPASGAQAQYPRYAPTATFKQASRRQKGAGSQQGLL